MFSKEHSNRDTDVGEGIFSGYFKEKPPEETGTTLTVLCGWILRSNWINLHLHNVKWSKKFMSKKDLKQKFMSKKNKQRIKNNEGKSLQLRWKLEQVALKVKVRVIEGI